MPVDYARQTNQYPLGWPDLQYNQTYEDHEGNLHMVLMGAQHTVGEKRTVCYAPEGKTFGSCTFTREFGSAFRFREVNVRIVVTDLLVGS